jgi:hypothetical protein
MGLTNLNTLILGGVRLTANGVSSLTRLTSIDWRPAVLAVKHFDTLSAFRDYLENQENIDTSSNLLEDFLADGLNSYYYPLVALYILYIVR